MSDYLQIPKVGLVITTYNRPEYLSRSLDSIAKSNIENTVVIIIDDASDNERTKQLIIDFKLPSNIKILKIFKEQKKEFAVHESLKLAWDILNDHYKVSYLCNIDSDTLVKKTWLQQLQSFFKREYKKQGPLIVTGFNTNNHPVLEEKEDYYIKKTIGGINMFFKAGNFYKDIVRPNLKIEVPEEKPNLITGWDWFLMWKMQALTYPILCTKPSVVQHIGEQGQFSNKKLGFDYAIDF